MFILQHFLCASAMYDENWEPPSLLRTLGTSKIRHTSSGSGPRVLIDNSRRVVTQKHGEEAMVKCFLSVLYTTQMVVDQIFQIGRLPLNLLADDTLWCILHLVLYHPNPIMSKELVFPIYPTTELCIFSKTAGNACNLTLSIWFVILSP